MNIFTHSNWNMFYPRYHTHFYHKIPLAKQIERFWVVDELPVSTKQSQEERDCEEHFRQYHTRDIEGRYVVKLPFKTNFKEMIGGSLDTALKRFLQLERRFKCESELKRGYEAVIDENMTRGYLNKISEERSHISQSVTFHITRF